MNPKSEKSKQLKRKQRRGNRWMKSLTSKCKRQRWFTSRNIQRACLTIHTLIGLMVQLMWRVREKGRQLRRKCHSTCMRLCLIIQWCQLNFWCQRCLRSWIDHQLRRFIGLSKCFIKMNCSGDKNNNRKSKRRKAPGRGRGHTVWPQRSEAKKEIGIMMTNWRATKST